MKILILEDNENKLDEIKSILEDNINRSALSICKNYTDFVKRSTADTFDLIIVDLVVPLFHDSTRADDTTDRIIEHIRLDKENVNFNTPVIAITSFPEIASSNYGNVNGYDINIINYCSQNKSWESQLLYKACKYIPKLTYEYVIFCALEKEAKGFIDAGYEVSEPKIINELSCLEITGINGKLGLIVTQPRMGLVSAAITCSRAIELFSPKVVAMSGICAGIEGRSNIYDIIIPENCTQHDAGKWASGGFIPERFSIPLQPSLRLKLNQVLKDSSFISNIMNKLDVSNYRLPKNIDSLDLSVKIAPTSSGSAVIADENHLEEVKEQHRKLAAFEMESYALYQAAFESTNQPKYFSAKCVVDNGNNDKSDDFHQLACILSAKCVYEIIGHIL